MTSGYTTDFRRLRRATQGRPAPFAALVVAIIVILVATPQAQQPAPAFVASVTPTAGAAPMAETPTDVDLLVGRSTVLNVGAPIARVSLTVPDIADAMVTAPGQLLIHGKQPGTISLFVWDRGGAIKTYEVRVRRDLTALGQQLKQLFPRAYLLRGRAMSRHPGTGPASTSRKSGDVRGRYVEEGDVVTADSRRGGPNQVSCACLAESAAAHCRARRVVNARLQTFVRARPRALRPVSRREASWSHRLPELSCSTEEAWAALSRPANRDCSRALRADYRHQR